MAMELGDDHEHHVAAAAAAGGGKGKGKGNMILPQPSTDFRKAGAIPFKWEIQPGIPKPTYKAHHRHDQTLLLSSSSENPISPLKQQDHDHDQQAAPQKLIPAALRPPPISDHHQRAANYQPHDVLNAKLSSSSCSTGSTGNYSTAANSRRQYRWSNSPAISSTDHPMQAHDLRIMSSRVVSLRICLPTFRSLRKRLSFFSSIGRLNSSRTSTSCTNTTPSTTVISKATFETVSEIGSPVLVSTLCSSNSTVTPPKLMFLQRVQEQQPPIGRCSSSITSHGRDQEYNSESDHHPRMLTYNLPSRPFSSFREISAPSAGRFDEEEEEEETAGSDHLSTNNYRNSNRTRINRNDLEWAAYGLF